MMVISVTLVLPQMIRASAASSHIDLALFCAGGAGGSWSAFLQYPCPLDIPSVPCIM